MVCSSSWSGQWVELMLSSVPLSFDVGNGFLVYNRHNKILKNLFLYPSWHMFKGQCHDMFDPFLGQKLYLGSTRSLGKLFYLWKLLTKITGKSYKKGNLILLENCVSAKLLTTQTRTKIVIDCADTIMVYSTDYTDMVSSAQLLTTWTWCRRSRWLSGHGVSIVVDYADMTMTTRT